MKYLAAIIAGLILSGIIIVSFQSWPNSGQEQIQRPISKIRPSVSFTQLQAVTPKPLFHIYKPLRSVKNLGSVLSDIESHMPANHIYRNLDKISWGHETSHGIHSRLRHEFRKYEKINSFYVLNDRAVIIKEPDTTIKKVANEVPRSLRGTVYRIYMIKQAEQWGNTPLYIFDEWVAYTNGSAIRNDLKIQNRGETVQYMLEFNVYAISLAKTVKSDDPQFKNFLMWHLDRAMGLYKINKEKIGYVDGANRYWSKVLKSADASEFRQFASEYFGANWTKKVLGF